MNTFRTILASLALFLSFQITAQTENMVTDLNFKLKLMDDNKTWGVFVVPGPSINPTKRSTTGSGQVTIVAPIDFTYIGLENVSGTWIENARVDGPMEAPGKAYISFGFVSDEPRIKYVFGKETLLFTFISEDSNAEIALIDNVNDPFSTPNTYNTNPGNDLGVIDFGHDGGPLYYGYGVNLETELARPNAALANKKATENKTDDKSGFKAIFVDEKIVVPGN